MQSALLEVNNLKVEFMMRTGTVRAVQGISFQLQRGETVCVVGETGSGKSVTALSILRLVGPGGRSYNTRIEGDIVYRPNKTKEYHILELSHEEMRSIRGREISMIYQEPMTCLNPVFTVGNQIAEVVIRHGTKTQREALRVAQEMMQLVGIPEAALRLKAFPHQLSGGMRQRIMIAMALACRPAILIADEPTTALDVTIQAQILDLIRRLQSELGTSVLFITHDLGVVAQLADRVIVMYAGRGVEIGKVDQIFQNPLHPYTKSLLMSIPRLWKSGQRPKRLNPIGGTVPNLAAVPPGCAFHPRCRWAVGRCSQEVPEVEVADTGHSLMCWRWRELQEVQ
jgi:oligopeptide transport system ATP-binding protein